MNNEETIPVPDGFVEFHPVDSSSVWHVQVDEISDYGPQINFGYEFITTVRLRGQPQAEARNVRGGLREIARLCCEAQKRTSYDVKKI